MLWLIVGLLVVNLVATGVLFLWVSSVGDEIRDLITELGQALNAFRR